MTAPIDDPETLRSILTNTDALLLDFDGPICSVFAGVPAPVVADQLRGVLAEGGYVDLPTDVRTADDPFDVLFYAAQLGPEEVGFVEAAFRAHEVEAAQSAQPTPHTADLITEWKSTGRPLAVVSNNSAAAVETYLEIHALQADIDCVSARVGADITLLKPSPSLLIEAANQLDVSLAHCTLVGDSMTDIQASHAAQIMAIGYANKPGKVARFRTTNVAAIITDTRNLVVALESDHRTSSSISNIRED